jgi:hypothetical protein
MADKLTIINRALLRIGTTQIASLDDGSAEAITATVLYPSVRDDFISRHRWDFGKGQVQLARLAALPAARWDSAYQIPAGIDNVVTVLVMGHPIAFDRYDDKIFCNAVVADQVFLEYTDYTDETRWPAWFVTVMEFGLASAFAIPIGDRNDLTDLYEKKADRHFALAKQLNGQGHTTKKLPTGRFRRARRGGTTELV